MSTPKFANTATPSKSRRLKKTGIDELEGDIQNRELIGGTITDESMNQEDSSDSITDFMSLQMQAKLREPTRPITLRFEESLWQRVEKLRGNLSKNDFFKELVNYYDKHAG